MPFVLHCTCQRGARHKVRDACCWSQGAMRTSAMQTAAGHLVPSGSLLPAPSALSCTGHGLNELTFCMCWLLSHGAHTDAGGSKKRGADIAGMPSKRSNLADRLGPAGMSTLAVLLGHDVTQADLDRLQQVGAAEGYFPTPRGTGDCTACARLSLCQQTS